MCHIIPNTTSCATTTSAARASVAGASATRRAIQRADLQSRGHRGASGVGASKTSHQTERSNDFTRGDPERNGLYLAERAEPASGPAPPSRSPIVVSHDDDDDDDDDDDAPPRLRATPGGRSPARAVSHARVCGMKGAMYLRGIWRVVPCRCCLVAARRGVCAS